MSPKDVKQDIRLIERSLKRNTSAGCEYDVPEEVAKKFIRLRQGADYITRLILQAQVNTFHEAFIDLEITGDLEKQVRDAVFNPADPMRAHFNQVLLDISTRKNNKEKAFARALKKVEKRKKRINKDFSEIAFREEFYFDKLTKQLVEQYEGRVSATEYGVVKLVFEFQKDLRLFNWNVVDKDAPIEFLFRIFYLLCIKNALLDASLPRVDELVEREGAARIVVARADEPEPVLFELLYLHERLRSIGGRLRRLEDRIFKECGDILEKGKKIQAGSPQDKLLSKYLEEIKLMDFILSRLDEIKAQGNLDGLDGDKRTFAGKIIASMVESTAPRLGGAGAPEQGVGPGAGTPAGFVEREYRLIRFFMQLFKKMFAMLMRKRTMSDMAVIKRLLSEIITHDKPRIAVLLGAVFINALIGMLVPLLFQQVIDVGLGDATGVFDLQAINFYGVVFLVFATITVVLSIVSNYTVQYLGNKTMFAMRNRMYENLQRLSFDYYNNQPSGKIISYITNDVETIQQLISSGFLTVFIDVFRLVGSVVFMIYISWELTLTAFMIIPFIGILGAYIFNKARRYFVIMRNKIAALTMHIQESVSGMRVIKAFAIEKKNYAQFNRANQENLEINLKAARLFSALPALITSVISLGIGALLVTGGWLFIQSRLGLLTDGFTRGNLFSFLIYLFQFFGPIIAFIQFLTNIQNSMAAGERIIRLVDAKPSVQEKARPISVDSDFFRSLNHDNITITFDNVNFEYEKGIPILKNINLKIKPKERLALVGYTGAGKTTFISLVARFWDVTSGRILINGQDIRNFSFEALRKLMGMVLQDNYLFSGTVMDNIRYGKPDATDEEVFAITRKLGIHEFIMNMEDGYNTPVRERGSRLSAGQKQLIAFARALLVDPPVLILDEATSSIDPYSELIVKDALDTLLKGRTSITIAHRLSTVLNSDRIIVMEDGRIVEEGTHDELVAKGGLYNHLYTMQFTRVARD